MNTSRPWFGTGALGQYVAVPCSWEGWATVIGISLPAAVYAYLGGGPGALLAIGLFAFLFGLSYAMAEEGRASGKQPDGPASGHWATSLPTAPSSCNPTPHVPGTIRTGA